MAEKRIWVYIDDDKRGDLNDDILVDEHEINHIALLASYDVSIQIAGQTICLEANNRFSIPKEALEAERGRTGAFTIAVDGIEYPIQVIPSNIDAEEFQRIQEDFTEVIGAFLTELLFIDFTDSQTQTTTKSADYYRIKFAENELNKLDTFLNQIETPMMRIDKSPHRKLEKEYFVLNNSNPTPRQDEHTLRWNACRGNENRQMTFRYSESIDTRPNHFVKFATENVKAEFDLVNDRLKMHEEELAERKRRYEEKLTSLNKHYGMEEEEEKKATCQNIESLRPILQQVSSIVERAETLKQRLEAVTNLAFLTNVEFVPTFQMDAPDLVLTSNPDYNAVYCAYLDWLERHSDKNLKLFEYWRENRESLTLSALKRTSKIYEYWIFLKLCQKLVALSFKPSGYENLSQTLKGIINIEEGNLVIEPKRKIEFYSDILDTRIAIFYDWYVETQDIRPDIIIGVEAKGIKKLFILDMKYKPYNKQPNWHRKDLKTVTQYRDKIRYADSAFVVHPDNTDDDSLHCFGAMRQSHQIGSICLRPNGRKTRRYTETVDDMLSKLFWLILGYKMEFYNRCFRCGSEGQKYSLEWGEYNEPIEIKVQYEPQNPEGIYKCPQCQERWSINHCWKCKTRLIKIYPDSFLNFHHQHFRGRKAQPCKSAIEQYLCPNCYACYCEKEFRYYSSS